MNLVSAGDVPEVLAAGDLLLGLALLSFLVFVAIYAYLTAWEAKPLGRHLMMSSLALILLLALPTNFETVDAKYPFYEYARLVVLSFVIYVGISRTALLIRTQREARRRDRKS